MSIAEKLTTIAENTQKVYEAGKQAEYDAFWDMYQENGERTSYQYGFAGFGWTDETFKPKYDITPIGAANGLFRETQITNLKQCLESCNVVLDLSKCNSFPDGFNKNPYLKILPILDFSAMPGTTNVFYNDSALEIIEGIKSGEKTAFATNTFYKCNSLIHMIVTGIIGQNGLNLQWSTLLDRESLLSIIGVLQDKTSAGGTWTVTLGSENLAKLTDTEKAVATQKGWTLV